MLRIGLEDSETYWYGWKIHIESIVQNIAAWHPLL
jgi:hypothetical protein